MSALIHLRRFLFFALILIPTIGNACVLEVRTEVVPQYPFPPSGQPIDAILPNTPTYVRGSMLRPPEGSSAKEEFRCVCLECTDGEMTHLVEFKPVLEACGPLEGRTEWSANVQVEADGMQSSHALSDTDPYMCLPEGSHTASLSGSLATNLGTGGAPRFQVFESNSFSVLVENIIVVVLGDSYSSGEGSPAGRATASNWRFISDDDFEGWSRRTRADRLVQQGKRVVGLWQRQTFEPIPLVDEGARIRLGGPGWGGQISSHFEAHRSPFATASLAAMLLEESSNESSVTFINLAESGATIERGALWPGCVPETGCAATFDGSQIDRLHALIGSREIDHLVLGFGGNDAGFARVATAFIMREPSFRAIPNLDYPSRREIRNAIRTGDWAVILDSETKVAGLDGLPRAYESLNDALSSTLATSLDGAQIYLMEYPPVHKKRGPSDETGSYCEFLGRIAPHVNGVAALADSVGGHLNRSHVWLQILADSDNHPLRVRVDEGEARDVDEMFFRPLLRAQAEAAERFGWRLVELPDTFLDHNICAGRPYALHRRDSYQPTLPPAFVGNGRWFRAGIEGFVISGSSSAEIADNTAMLHPNESGYANMAAALFDEMTSAPPAAPEPGTWSDIMTNVMDGILCESVDLGLQGTCGPINSSCEPRFSQCLVSMRNANNGCRVQTRQCQ